jgi:hypothetical protein
VLLSLCGAASVDLYCILLTLRYFGHLFFVLPLRTWLLLITDSRTETEYCLQHEFGIPAKNIPLTNANKIKLTQWKLWIKMRELIDADDQQGFLRSMHHRRLDGQIGDYPFTTSQPSSFDVPSSVTGPKSSQRPVDCPDMTTIVFRNGGNMFNHPPNKVLRAIAASKEGERDLAVTNDDRRKIVDDILNELRGLGFGFCRWNQGVGWYTEFDSSPEGEQMLRTCVSSALKDHLRRIKAARNCQEPKEQKADPEQGNVRSVDTFTNQDHHLKRHKSEGQTTPGIHVFCSVGSRRKRKGGFECGD